MWKSRHFTNSIAAIRKVSASNNLTIIHIELLFDAGNNCFVVTNPTYLYELVPRSNAVEITGCSKAAIEFKGTSRVCLNCEEIAIIVQMKDVPCINSNPHHSFPLTLLKYFGLNNLLVLHATK